ncbi:M20 family metallo-hydrolase [Sulfurospirillum barnesii]|uniref:Amidase, hydantoinase/carbamoylase family n=1 Tax=Sulfurospirillum barnesii (strain ATCC 700032 / DSM 10660 / SES-3) TaxID=760154 RepID=I3XVZ0_SULBS|nr:M20 family metallo-hydrolase [Sulfurospirillum barnesii]AFL68114.1 amidase, hydantoinase/carbamoylase family [Sulfurospirillum barnesii SES-3]
MINATRLSEEIKTISRFGALPQGGITRLAFSKEEAHAREYVKTLMQAVGMTIREDAIGNIFGRIEGELPLPAVAIGSHLDSVPLGGCFDGTLGVMCGLEAIRAIKEQKISHKRPFELIIFSCEESSRFNMATVGSKVMAGKLSTEALENLKDKEGISLYEAAKEFGCAVETMDNATLPPDTFYAYLELHIEQGPVLENKNIPVGIVTGIAAPIRYALTLQGRADHSGATPMNMRADALACAAEIILHVENVAKEKAGETTVATVGFANATPGVLNVIPGSVSLGIDIRDIDHANLEKAALLIEKGIEKITHDRGLIYTLKVLTHDIPVSLDKKIIETLENEAKKLHIPTLKLPSGAGHDAMHMPYVSTHTGMVFVPCKEGISHNIAEEVNMDDVMYATEVITKTLITLANEG